MLRSIFCQKIIAFLFYRQLTKLITLKNTAFFFSSFKVRMRSRGLCSIPCFLNLTSNNILDPPESAFIIQLSTRMLYVALQHHINHFLRSAFVGDIHLAKHKSAPFTYFLISSSTSSSSPTHLYCANNTARFYLIYHKLHLEKRLSPPTFFFQSLYCNNCNALITSMPNTPTWN